MDLIIKIFSAIIGFLGFLWGIFKFVFPLVRDLISKKKLMEELSRGPFDEETIERSVKNYIRPKIATIDPAQEVELRHMLMATKEDMFKKIDDFLYKDSSKRHLLILADSGMGKTSFVLNYYAHNMKKRNKRKLAIIPLGIDNADEWIEKIDDKKNTAIILDAFDEDTQAIKDHKKRIHDLMILCKYFRRVIITSRTQFFPKDEEIPVETGIAKIGPRSAGEKRYYEFWKLYIMPFEDEEIERYLRKRFKFWERKKIDHARSIINKIPLLSVRPMLLSHIPDVMKSNLEIEYAYQLYEIMIDAWLQREDDWVDPRKMRKFSENIAVDIFVNSGKRGWERVPKGEIIEYAKLWNIDLAGWQITGRSLLNRDARGNYKFAHRSIMEYLVVNRVIFGDQHIPGFRLTDQMIQFLFEMLPGEKLPYSQLRKLSGLDIRVRILEKAAKTVPINDVMTLITSNLYGSRFLKIEKESSTEKSTLSSSENLYLIPVTPSIGLALEKNQIFAKLFPTPVFKNIFDEKFLEGHFFAKYGASQDLSEARNGVLIWSAESDKFGNLQFGKEVLREEIQIISLALEIFIKYPYLSLERRKTQSSEFLLTIYKKTLEEKLGKLKAN